MKKRIFSTISVIIACFIILATASSCGADEKGIYKKEGSVNYETPEIIEQSTTVSPADITTLVTITTESKIESAVKTTSTISVTVKSNVQPKTTTVAKTTVFEEKTEKTTQKTEKTTKKNEKNEENEEKTTQKATEPKKDDVNTGNEKEDNKNAVKTISPLDFNVELDENGIPKNYSQKLTGRATAYCSTEPGGNHTATGKVAQVGYIAVNPKIIPYGTKMYIKTADNRYIYGCAVAEDTGGFINWSNPPIADLYFDTEAECYQFGVRNIEIYIL
ncbi:MAG: 3D domain-containing protein [Bacteroidales bacterium]|nr:3D domain-containing protein [Bacteroidales bacterium]